MTREFPLLIVREIFGKIKNFPDRSVEHVDRFCASGEAKRNKKR
jgi:hypothetical protein